MNELARRAGVSAATVCVLESGKRWPSASMVTKLASALGVPLESEFVYQRGALIPAKWDVEWARLDELAIGDLLVTPRELTIEGDTNTLPSGRELTVEQAWLMGLIVGDGTVFDDKVEICVYGSLRDRAFRALQSMGVASGTQSKHAGVSVYSTALAHELEDAGLRGRSFSKTVPGYVWQWGERRT